MYFPLSKDTKEQSLALVWWLCKNSFILFASNKMKKLETINGIFPYWRLTLEELKKIALGRRVPMSMRLNKNDLINLLILNNSDPSKSSKVNEVVVDKSVPYCKMKCPQLRAIVEEKGIKLYHKLKKEELTKRFLIKTTWIQASKYMKVLRSF